MKLLHSHALVSDQEQSLVWAWQQDSWGLPLPLQPIQTATLKTLHAAKELLLIQLSGKIYEAMSLPLSDIEWEFWGSNRSLRESSRAVFVRTYHSGRPAPLSSKAGLEQGVEDETAAIGEDEEVFTHCRSFYSQHCHIGGAELFRSTSVWEEHVDYCGLAVSGNILGEVYALGGESAAWRVPGRGLTLPDEAWEVLRGWKRGHAESVGAAKAYTVVPLR